ncbi:hypothetical protein SeLEV6574_g02347 [Synchytrium endobioticum]|nr:hypothetical protein SeLEV6574_g02347 [Synchytrium endobioticum]
MLTLYILLCILLLQSSHGADAEPTVYQLNAWRDEIRQFRYKMFYLGETKLYKDLENGLFELLESRKPTEESIYYPVEVSDRLEFEFLEHPFLTEAAARFMYNQLYTRDCHSRLSRDRFLTKVDEAKLACLLIEKIVPKDARLTLESLKELPEDLSQDFLELYWECYETFLRVVKHFEGALKSRMGLSLKFNWLYTARRKCQEQLRQKVFQAILGPTDKGCPEVSASCNMLMATERARIADRFKQLQDPDVSVLSSLTQAHMITLDASIWCARNFIMTSSALQAVPRTMEKLIYYVNFNALVVEKVDLITSVVSRFLDEKECNLPGRWEQYDIDTLRKAPDRERYGLAHVQRSQSHFLRRVVEYKEELGRMLDLDFEGYLEEDNFEREISSNEGVPGPLSKLGIFLRLHPSDVPRKYLKLAEKVHSLYFCHDDTVTDLEIRKSLYSAFHTAVLSYRKELTCMLETVLTRDNEYYLRKLQEYIDKRVPFDFASKFPELGIFLELRPFEVPPQYLELAEKVHLVHTEYLKPHDDGQLSALTMITQTEAIHHPMMLYSAFHLAAKEYGQTLELIQQSLETENIEYYLWKLKTYIARNVPFDFANEFPELGIFLQLHPSDVPPQYLELAELIHPFSFGFSIPDELVTNREYEITSQEALCSALSRVALPESSHASRNDVAYADLNRATIPSNRGSGRRADIADPSSSRSHGRVGFRRNHRS